MRRWICGLSCGRADIEATDAESIRDGKLFVRVKNAAWRNELLYLKKEIIDKINGEMKQKIVKDIIFIEKRICKRERQKDKQAALPFDDSDKKGKKGQNVSGEYTANDITVLKGLEPVRQRPAMYIGDISARGLHHLVTRWSIIRLTRRWPDTLTTFGIHKQERFRDGDRRRTRHPHGNTPGGETFRARSCHDRFARRRQIRQKHIQGFGRTACVGVSVVNALSEYLEVEVSRDGKLWYQKYVRGKPQGDVKVTGKADPKKPARKRRFCPTTRFFKNRIFKFETLAERLRELPFSTRTWS